MPSEKIAQKNKSPHPFFHIASHMDNKTDALFVPLFESVVPRDIAKLNLPSGVMALVSQTLQLADFKGWPGTLLVIPGTGKIKRIVLLGLGKREKFDIDMARWAGALAAHQARKFRAVHVTIHYGQLANMRWPEMVAAVAEGLTLGTFDFEDYKSKKSDDDAHQAATLQALHVHILTPEAFRGDILKRVREKVAIAVSANYARHIACQPGNVITPRGMIAAARDLSLACRLKFTLVTADRARKLGMGGLCAVGQGSVQPPALVLLEYLPPGRNRRRLKTFAITGKSVTFDTGGISIKPAADMGAMKYDKCGGTVVLGVLRAAAALKLPHRVIGVIPIAENSVDAHAYRPGDIIRMYNGKSVDISNTDAEGRLILADAMAYACEKFKPDVLIDLATLTGGVVVALGSVFAGLFASDDKLATDLIAAGEYTGEWLWRLPLHDRYRMLLETPHADISNSGGREAQPIQGGMFLREFVPPNVKWAHLDIAGVANQKKEFRYWRSDAASGFGVRLLVQYLQQYK
jgi:leucyl aminopeptidase